MLSRSIPLATAAWLVAAAAILTGCSATPQDSLDGEPTVEEIEIGAEQPGTTVFADGTLTSSKLSIRITDSAVIPQGESGNEYGEAPVLAVWFETTNTSGEEIDPLTAWLTHARAYQTVSDLPAELSLGMAPDSELSMAMTTPIPADATVIGAVAYLLADDEAPVELVLSDTFLTEVGRMSLAVG
ncbi:DUF5067 domain-containing protein [Salinibacterium sp. ZJ70]|uniref:DUF5067 domain-containing protein n=1 Tax=Salinibacterium sp. ZJ70 TaxID=2708084 RepID=UPI0014246109|nr:DUF5067 domain-containing protein [Salinibacterium sp. ZJ70]